MFFWRVRVHTCPREFVHMCKHAQKMPSAPEYLFKVPIIVCPPVAQCDCVSVCELFQCTQAIQSTKRGDRDDTWAERQG